MAAKKTDKSCVVVLDGHGSLHAAEIGPGQTAKAAARHLVKQYIPYESREVFHYTVVENCDDPGAARLLGRGKTVLGQFRMGDE